MRKISLKILTVLVFVAGVNGGYANGGIVARTGVEAVEKLAPRAVSRFLGQSAVRGGEALSRVSSKKILAAGVGVAAVTAAHEVADGAQTLLEQTGNTIRENPDKADSILGQVMKPVNRVIILMTLVLVGIVWWFIKPWISLFRNWSKLRAVKAEKKMNAVNRSGYVGLPIIGTLSVLSICAIVIITVCFASGESNGIGPSGVTHEYQAELEKLQNDFCREVREIADCEFGKVRTKVPAVAKRFGTFSKCKDLMVCMVSDKFKGGNTTGDSVRRELEEGYYDGLYTARDRVLARVAKLQDEAKGLSEKYHSALVEVGVDVEQKKRDLAIGQLSMGLSTAIEAVFIRQTVKSVAKVLGKSAARMAGALAVGGGAAVADGPLPIGDVIGALIAAGGAAWTAADIYQATKVLPQKLEESLYSGIEKCKEHCIEEAIAAGKALIETAQTR